ncbi:TadE-like protein [Maioricimonas rarisocia]|uniref:TadE-like protein n=1 Tax=Maioricimonas rarisocia TaxID=2528026 RepID=A0A517Z962_9PLAN|nr:TadE/TadG family type IV pilus assembly protein [Maioricimonas rarisocia]QDU38971.1 TadE-like protein [Maioricimonas rarisocia]
MQACRYRRRAANPRSGATIVEFAITAPVLFLVFFGMIEFARFNMVRHGMDSAVYEGARRGIVPGATEDDVKAKAEEVLGALSMTSVTVTVDPEEITEETTSVTVNVSVPIGSNSWVVPKYFDGVTMSRSCTLKRESLDTF